jgi:hypothetical protein
MWSMSICLTISNSPLFYNTTNQQTTNNNKKSKFPKQVLLFIIKYKISESLLLFPLQLSSSRFNYNIFQYINKNYKKKTKEWRFLS